MWDPTKHIERAASHVEAQREETRRAGFPGRLAEPLPALGETEPTSPDVEPEPESEDE